MKSKFVLIWLLIITVFVSVIFLNKQEVLAQSSTEFRSEISSLRIRISSLESEVRRLSQMNFKSNYGTPPHPNLTNQTDLPSIINPPRVDGESVGKSDPMFERLATLLIELKEDVRSLKRRLTTVEKEISN